MFLKKGNIIERIDNIIAITYLIIMIAVPTYMLINAYI